MVHRSSSSQLSVQQKKTCGQSLIAYNNLRNRSSEYFRGCQLKFVWKSVLTTLAVFAISLPAVAQNYPLPSKVGEAATICKDDRAKGVSCAGINSAGELVAGKPTYQYSSPIADHVGRLVDSSGVYGFQHHGMRTIRAGKVRTASSQRGTAPPRLYYQAGDALAAYSLDTLFSTRLPGGVMTSVNNTPNLGGSSRDFNGRAPFENYLLFDGFFYPEARATGWEVPLADKAERLADLDFDDRGLVYGAFEAFGWGIVRDTGETNGALMASIVQMLGKGSVSDPTVVISLKSGSKYYAVVARDGSAKRDIYDVTNPAVPNLVSSVE
ncbi:MAG TPA: hypothetical protein VF846_16625, partial [Thermoanaerobaculia bacterium]